MPPLSRTSGDEDVKMENGNATESPKATEEDPSTPNTTKTVKRRLMGVDPSLILSNDRSKRRRTPSPEPEAAGGKEDAADPKDPPRAKKLGLEIYAQIMDQKDSEGLSISEPFVKLPSKRALPDYYETIKHPMSLEMVHSKLQSSSYETLKDVITDLSQIFINAKRYNIKESLIFEYAKKLHKLTRTYYTDVVSAVKEEAEEEEDEEEPKEESAAPGDAADTSAEVEDVDMGEGPSNASADGESTAGATSSRLGKKRGGYMREGPTVYKLVKPVLKTIKEAKSKDGTGRDIAGIFLELPDRKELPDYYSAIQDPISLEEIEGKMVARQYATHEQFFHDLELMCKNAFIYNEDDSEVYRDAQQIKELAAQQRIGILERLQREQTIKFRVQTMPTATPPRLPHGSVPAPQLGYPPSASHAPIAFPATAYATPDHPPQPQASSSGSASYLPALPKGVVTEDIVASLNRYPAYEQQAWINSLPPSATQMYRQMVSVTEARKRLAQPTSTPGPLPPADLPSASRPSGTPSFPDRQAPPFPTIRCLDFAFHSADQPPERRQAIRLHNMKGVVTHAVILGSQTTEIELTAYIADAPAKPTETSSDSPSSSKEALETVPEMSLRVNGNQGSLPRFVFDGQKRDRPAGMRWTVAVPLSKVDSKIEVVATKPGAMTETTAIFVNRQM